MMLMDDGQLHHVPVATMTDPQKYAQLLEQHSVLGKQIDSLSMERQELRKQMDSIDLPNTFYYRLDDQLLYRDDNLRNTIRLRKFDV